MTTTQSTIIAEPLSERAWEPFGWLPVADTDPRDGASRLSFEWADAHVNLIHHDLDEVPRTGQGLVCEMMFHHKTHTQALLVLNCPAVIAVAPPGSSFDQAGDLAVVRAFLLRAGDALVLHRSTWHWGPFPISDPRVELFNVQGLRYAEDNACARFGDSGWALEIATAS